MPWPTPSLENTRQTLANDYELRYQQAGVTVDAHSRGTGHTEKVNAIAALAYGLKLNQQYIVNQLFISSMDDETLIKTGGELGLVRIAPAFAIGGMDCEGTDGIVIAKNSVVKHAGGAQYRVTADTAILGTTNVPLIAVETGVNGNLNADETLRFVNPISGVDSDAVVDVNGMTSGADIEPIDRYRDRVKARRKQPPMGGKYYDYVQWAKAASVDVTRAWVSPHETEVGQVVLRFVTEDLPSPFPSAGLVTVVNDYVQLLKPVEANLIVMTPLQLALNLTFTVLTPNTPEVQAAVRSELDDFLKNEVRSDSIVYLNKVRAAVSNAAGLEDFAFTLISNLLVGIDEYLTLGTTNFPA